MNRADISTALKKKLAEGGIGINGVWPNIDSTTALPYFETTQTVVDRTSSLKGDAVAEVGLFGVVIVVEAGTGETAANQYADAVAELFKAATTIVFTGGVVSVIAPPVIQGGFRDDANWRVPVVIRYRAKE